MILKKLLICLLILICILASGCSKPEIVGYTYDLDDESNLVRLQDIYSFENEIKNDQITGKMKMGNDIVKFDAAKIDSRTEYILYNGKLKFGNEEYNFDIAIYNAGTATGLFYDEYREFVNGFVIEKLVE